MIRYEFVDSSISEAVVHPDSIFSREQELANSFVSRLTSAGKIEPCPISGAERSEILFEKWGQKYAICPQTWSLSLAALPSEEEWRAYFNTSELARFRASAEYQEIALRLRKDLWENQLEWVEGRVRRYLGMNKYNVIDWGCKLTAWNEYLSRAVFVNNVYVEEPLPPVEEKLPGSNVDLIILFDVTQRMRYPQELFNKVAEKLRPGGLVVITCRSGSGFDLLTLRENSESIFPLDHICLPSPGGMQLLLERAGFEVLELTTPGLLDLQFVKGAGKLLPHDQYLARYIIEQCKPAVLERFQSFLQQNNLSSHMRAVARKPDNI